MRTGAHTIMNMCGCLPTGRINSAHSPTWLAKWSPSGGESASASNVSRGPPRSNHAGLRCSLKALKSCIAHPGPERHYRLRAWWVMNQASWGRAAARRACATRKTHGFRHATPVDRCFLRVDRPWTVRGPSVDCCFLHVGRGFTFSKRNLIRFLFKNKKTTVHV